MGEVVEEEDEMSAGQKAGIGLPYKRQSESKNYELKKLQGKIRPFYSPTTHLKIQNAQSLTHPPLRGLRIATLPTSSERRRTRHEHTRFAIVGSSPLRKGTTMPGTSDRTPLKSVF